MKNRLQDPFSLLKTKNIIIILTVLLFAVKAQAQLQPAIPLDAYGVWDRKHYMPSDDTHIGILKGVKVWGKWKDLQPNGPDTFDWSDFDEIFEYADQHDLYTHIGIGVGPECPDWIYDEVPKMYTDTNELGGEFPYYIDSDYKRYYFKLLEELGKYIQGLPQKQRESIIFVQARTGCTGDEVPVKGNYLPESIKMTDQEWKDFRLESFGKFKQYIADPLDMPLHFNNIDYNTNTTEWNWVNNNITTGFGIKGSAYVRGHHLTWENKYKDTWYNMLVNPKDDPEVNPHGIALFTRAEMDQSQTRPLYEINKPLAFYWGVLSGLNTGLSIWDHTQRTFFEALVEYPEIIESLEFFNRYAPEIYPATTKGAYSIFHEGLDSEDVDKFPVSKYGNAAKTNEQRYINICNDPVYAARGAQMDHPEKAVKGQVDQRRNQTGYNDAGWGIYPGNYERWIEQIDPDGTSIGLFRLNANSEGLLNKNNSKYDRFARSFENSTGKNTMYFKFHEDVFSETAGVPDVITFELIWLDKHANSTWELQYDAGAGNIKTAHTATGTGNNQWKTITVTLNDAVMNNNGPNGADFMLVNTDDIDDIFHGFEASISRKEATLNIGNIDVSSNGKVKLYPNPVNDVLNVSFEESIVGPKSISIYNMLGTLIYRVQTNKSNEQIDMNLLGTKGVLIIKIDSQNEVSSHKVVVN